MSAIRDDSEGGVRGKDGKRSEGKRSARSGDDIAREPETE